jgi:hypothetical protein
MDNELNGLVIDENGTKRWYQNNRLHRLDGPAIEEKNGTKYWLKEGKLHREAIDPLTGEVGAAKEYPDGSKEWFVNGLCHRENKPAIINRNGAQIWYQYGVQHREDGPAFISNNGNKQWIYHGEQMTEEEFNIIKDIVKEKEMLTTLINELPSNQKKIKI